MGFKHKSITRVLDKWERKESKQVRGTAVAMQDDRKISPLEILGGCQNRQVTFVKGFEADERTP